MESKIFRQPPLNDDVMREVDFKTEIVGPYRVYGVIQVKPEDRYIAVQVVIDAKGKVQKVMQSGMQELEKEFAELELMKLLRFAERMHL